MNWLYWVAVGIGIMAEFLGAGFLVVWLIGGVIGAFIADVLGASIWIQVVAFLIGFVVALFAWALIENNKTNKKFVGKTAIVSELISNVDGKGTVTFSGIEYKARSVNNESIEKDESVIIVSIDQSDLTLTVTTNNTSQ